MTTLTLFTPAGVLANGQALKGFPLKDFRMAEGLLAVGDFHPQKGMEVGFGGVWVGAAPNFMYIPIEDGDTPKPAGPPQILLDGWGYQDTHETLNTFQRCHGIRPSLQDYRGR